MARSPFFPTAGFEPGNHPPRRRARVRYVCAKVADGEKGGCHIYCDLPERQIKNGRIPRCDCGEPLKPAPKHPPRGKSR